VAGSNPKVDDAIEMFDSITNYLRQTIEETVNFENSIAQLNQLFRNSENRNPTAS
jgi:flagellar biosynthesis/type III secretory pathway ATPase